LITLFILDHNCRACTGALGDGRRPVDGRFLTEGTALTAGELVLPRGECIGYRVIRVARSSRRIRRHKFADIRWWWTYDHETWLLKVALKVVVEKGPPIHACSSTYRRKTICWPHDLDFWPFSVCVHQHSTSIRKMCGCPSLSYTQTSRGMVILTFHLLTSKWHSC